MSDNRLASQPATELEFQQPKDSLVKMPAPWLLVLCVAMGPLAMTAAVPANTQIMRDFSTEYGVAQTMLTFYLIAMSISQLFLGFLSDRFGRRPIMIAGLAIFAFGCLLSAIAPTLELLLFSRVVQGLGGSAGVSISRAIVRDVYSREKSASVIGYMSMAMIVAPMVGPGLGGLLTELASWRYIFVIMTILAIIVLLLVCRQLPETGSSSRDLKPRFVRSALTLLGQRAYRGYTASLVFAAGMFYAFQSGAPYLVLEVMQRSPSEYGMYFALTALGYFLGNFASGRFSERYGPDRMIMIALLPVVIGVVVFWLLAGTQHPLALFLPMMCLTFSNGLTIPNAMAAALSVRPSLAGTAAGISGFLQVGMGGLLTLVVGFTQNGLSWPLLSAITACGILTIVGAWLGQRTR